MGARAAKRPRAQHDAAYRAVCELLREARESAGLTQRDLATRLNRPRSFISKIEQAERRMDVVELVRWCRGCGVEPLKFFATAIRKVD